MVEINRLYIGKSGDESSRPPTRRKPYWLGES